VPRRFTLVALWAVFAVASVSVGFAAAGLVSDPFTDVGSSTDVSTFAGPGDEPVTVSQGAPGGQATAPPTPPTKTPEAGKPTHTPSPSGTTGSADPTKRASNTSSAPSIVKGGIPTQGGYVSGTCQGGVVSVGAAPAVYWQVASITPGRVTTARVRFEPAQHAQGERVDVTASCRGGNPVFHAQYRAAGGGGDGGDGGGDGGDDDGGGGGSGGGSGGSGDGGSDSSGSGSG
jgi:hypothetical protein